MKRYFVILFVFLLINNSCNILGDAENELVREELACNSKFKAVLYVKYGGATVDNSIQLSIIRKHDKLKDKMAGNIFVADADHGSTIIDSSTAFFEWVSCDTLKITYDSRLRIFNQQSVFKNFAIIYNIK